MGVPEEARTTLAGLTTNGSLPWVLRLPEIEP